MSRPLIDAFLRRSPAQWMAKRAVRNRLAVLAYHGISDPQRFASQLEYLRRHCTIVDLSGALRLLRGESPIPRRPVLLTFDDGEPSLLQRGLPILRRYEVPAVAYVVAGLVGTDSPYWWVEVERLMEAGAASPHGKNPAATIRALKRVPNAERLATIEHMRRGHRPVKSEQLTADEVRELAANGVEIGNHSWSHPCLDRCDDDVIATEIADAQRRLAEILGAPPRSAAYPNGNHDERVRRVAEAAGFEVAFAFDHRLSTIPRDDLMVVSRVRVASHTSPDRFATIISGLHPRVHQLRGGT